MFGSIEMKGYLKAAPNKFADLEGNKVSVTILLDEDDKKDVAVINVENDEKTSITLPYIWHETVDGGKVRLCTSSGVFKLYI